MDVRTSLSHISGSIFLTDSAVILIAQLYRHRQLAFLAESNGDPNFPSVKKSLILIQTNPISRLHTVRTDIPNWRDFQ